MWPISKTIWKFGKIYLEFRLNNNFWIESQRLMCHIFVHLHKHTYTWARSHFFLHQIRLLSVFLYSCRVLFTVAIYLSLSCCALARTRPRACVLIRSECSFRTKSHNARHRNASPLYLSNVRRCVLSECVQWRIALNVFLFEATFIVSTVNTHIQWSMLPMQNNMH